jgi:hypothetical protein
MFHEHENKPTTKNQKKKTIRTQKSKRKHNNAIKTLMVVIKENLVKQAVTSSIIFMKSIHDFL